MKKSILISLCTLNLMNWTTGQETVSADPKLNMVLTMASQYIDFAEYTYNLFRHLGQQLNLVIPETFDQATAKATEGKTTLDEKHAAIVDMLRKFVVHVEQAIQKTASAQTEIAQLYDQVLEGSHQFMQEAHAARQ